MSDLLEQQFPTTDRAVNVDERDGIWIVTVIEAGVSESVDFQLRSTAESFAAGQRIRLKLERGHEIRPAR